MNISVISAINIVAMLLFVVAFIYLFNVFSRAYRRRCSYCVAWFLYGAVVVFLIAIAKLFHWYAMK